MAYLDFKLLLFGHDTVQCAYYLDAGDGGSIDFEHLAIEREAARQSKSREPLTLGIASALG